MTREADVNFISEKNKEANTPIWLYEVELGGEDGILYLAEWPDHITFPEGVSGAPTFQSFPITHGSISQNTEGRVDEVSLVVANVNQMMQAYVEQKDGLRGHEVTINVVFADLLDVEDAIVQDTFVIDSCLCEEKTITFSLTTKLDLLSVKLPRHNYVQNFCQWQYRGFGCWGEDDDGEPEQPTAFVEDWSSGEPEGGQCNKTMDDCFRHGNVMRFGGFLSIPGAGARGLQ